MSKIQSAYTTRDRTMDRVLIGTGVLNQRIKEVCCTPNGLTKTRDLMSVLFEKVEPVSIQYRAFTEDEQKLFDKL